MFLAHWLLVQRQSLTATAGTSDCYESQFRRDYLKISFSAHAIKPRIASELVECVHLIAEAKNRFDYCY